MNQRTPHRAGSFMKSADGPKATRRKRRKASGWENSGIDPGNTPNAGPEDEDSSKQGHEHRSDGGGGKHRWLGCVGPTGPLARMQDPTPHHLDIRSGHEVLDGGGRHHGSHRFCRNGQNLRCGETKEYGRGKEAREPNLSTRMTNESGIRHFSTQLWLKPSQTPPRPTTKATWRKKRKPRPMGQAVEDFVKNNPLHPVSVVPRARTRSTPRVPA